MSARIAARVLAALLAVATTLSGPVRALAADPAEQARAAYNAGRYAEAASGFLAAVQAAPRDAELYRGLARARVWTKDHAGAVIAYRFYLELATGLPEGDRAKIQAELDNALSQLQNPPPDGPPAGPARLLDEATRRAEAGDAPGALDRAAEALGKGYFSPRLAELQAALVAPLNATYAAQLDAFAAPDKVLDAAALGQVQRGYEKLARLRPLSTAEAAVAGGAAGLLAYQAGHDADAVQALLPHAPSDPRLRVALALSLLRLGRPDEAASSLASLASDDRHVQFLLGVARAAAGQDPTAAFRRALEIP